MRHGLALALAVASFPAAAQDLPPAQQRSHLENFKDMAFAGCIARAYADAPSVVADAQASAGGYLEFNDFDVDAGMPALQALIARTLATPYASWQGPEVKLSLMKCIDLRHSAELDALGRQHSADPEGSIADGEPPR